MKDYYKDLEVIKTATAQEIRKSYKRLALKYHPDKNKTKEGGIRFTHILEAYEILSDEDKRHNYDNQTNNQIHMNTGDLFNTIFRQTSVFKVPAQPTHNISTHSTQKIIHNINGEIHETIIENINGNIKITKKITRQ